MYRVRLSPQAERFYREADRPLAKKLAKCFGQLQRDPRGHNNITPLKGKFAGFNRYRVGDYRVVFAIDDAAQTVNVALIAHRRNAYE
jgi:mRNA interferase RelE/StbE